MPGSLPTGVSGFFPTAFWVNSVVNGGYMLAEMINLGSYDISGSGTFTDGNAMPTENVLGVSRQLNSPIIGEVTTALSFSSTCTLTTTYTDQDGNTGASTGAVSLTTGWLVGQMGFLTLASGDCGTIDITNITRGGSPGSPSGVIKFWGIIPYGMVPIFSSSWNGAKSLVAAGGFALRKLGVNAQLGLIRLGATTAGATLGEVILVGDS
jgi:hypothetical protein